MAEAMTYRSCGHANLVAVRSTIRAYTGICGGAEILQTHVRKSGHGAPGRLCRCAGS